MPKEADRLQAIEADSEMLKKYIYTHNYYVRGSYDTSISYAAKIFVKNKSSGKKRSCSQNFSR